MMCRNIAIILASGTGTRFRSETPKQFLKLAGKTVLEHTLDVFERHAHIDDIVLVVAAENRLLTEELVRKAGYRKVAKIITGGATRRQVPQRALPYERGLYERGQVQFPFPQAARSEPDPVLPRFAPFCRFGSALRLAARHPSFMALFLVRAAREFPYQLGRILHRGTARTK